MITRTAGNAGRGERGGLKQRLSGNENIKNREGKEGRVTGSEIGRYFCNAMNERQ